MTIEQKIEVIKEFKEPAIAALEKYLDSIYKKIESGKYPTVGEIKSNKVESFFEILNWHPYNLKDVEINDYWLSTQMNLRKVILAHNDKARKVWYTENGWCDFKRENEKQLILSNQYMSYLLFAKKILRKIQGFQNYILKIILHF